MLHRLNSSRIPFTGGRLPSAWRRTVAVFLVLVVHFAPVGNAEAALEPGVYLTLPGAVVEEFGEHGPKEKRLTPVSATITLGLGTAEPSLTAWMPNAPVEDRFEGAPFPLTVKDSEGARLPDGSYRFSGDYLKEIHPQGTQYLYEWTFSPLAGGRVLWNGRIFWAGGHIWDVTITNLILVPRDELIISRLDAASIQIMWATNFANHILESASSLPAVEWSAVPNAVVQAGDWFSVNLEGGETQRFFRLRQR